jgi:hypothetical protein
VCRDASREVQIHHIDENPSNHDRNNLAPLCFEDHNRTLIKGGFGRQLSAGEIRQYRDDWLSRVASQRANADELASIAMAKLAVPPPSHPHRNFVEPPLPFIFALPAVRRSAIAHVQARDATSTVAMREASQEYVEAMKAIAIALAAYLPSSEPEAVNPRDYFDDRVHSLLSIHWQRLEPDGLGTGGSVVSVEAWAAVASDIDDAVSDLVHKLSRWDSKINFAQWSDEWSLAASTIPNTSVTERIAAVVEAELRDRRMQTIGPILAAIGDQLALIHALGGYYRESQALNFALQPYRQKLLLEKLEEVVRQSQMVLPSAYRHLAKAHQLLVRFEAMVEDSASYERSPARLLRLSTYETNDGRIPGLSELLDETTDALTTAENELMQLASGPAPNSR